jgi:hypothetical protein
MLVRNKSKITKWDKDKSNAVLVLVNYLRVEVYKAVSLAQEPTIQYTLLHRITIVKIYLISTLLENILHYNKFYQYHALENTVKLHRSDIAWKKIWRTSRPMKERCIHIQISYAPTCLKSSTLAAKILVNISTSHHIVFANSKFSKIKFCFDEIQPWEKTYPCKWSMCCNRAASCPLHSTTTTFSVFLCHMSTG